MTGFCGAIVGHSQKKNQQKPQQVAIREKH